MRIKPEIAARRRAGRLAFVGTGLLGLMMASLIALTTATSAVSAAAGAWSPTGAMLVGRYNNSSILLPDGDVLVFGMGISQIEVVQRYTPSTGTWRTTGSMITTRAYFTATLLGDGEVLVVGGSNGTPLATAELYNPSTETWRTTGSMISPRLQHTATLLANGKVLIAAGDNNGGVPLTEAEVYDPATETFSATGPMTAAGYDETSVLLHDGTVLVTGGSLGAAAEIYDPATGQWHATGSQLHAYPQATTTVLPDGRVLVAGGLSYTGTMYYPSLSTAATELYDPASGTWQAGPDMSLARAGSAAVVLADGTVLMIGGQQVGMISTIRGMTAVTMTATSEVYNPTTNSWTVGSDMGQARISHTGTVLADGRVLVAGGSANGPNGLTVLTSAEIYDPSATPPALPTLTAMSPNTATSQGGWLVTLTGTNLSEGHVFFGGTVVAGASCTATSCTFATPATAAGTFPVTVATAAGTTSALTFTVTAVPPPPPAPKITKINPTTGPAAGGTKVTITGTNLTAGTVKFGASAATSVSCSASSCSATSPAGSGIVDLTVTTAGGTSAIVSADRFTYQAPPAPPAPKVTTITPTTGPATGGTTVTVTGSNLSAGTVRFGTVAATNVACAATSCTVTSPAGTGAVDVTVSTAGGTSATSTADRFTYQAAGGTSNLIPNPGFETGGVPSDRWGSALTRSSAVVHSGAWSLAQTTSSSSGGWDLDANSSWYAPVTSGKTYVATVWVYATKSVKVNLNVDLLKSSGSYAKTVDGPTVTLAANTWTQLTVTAIKPASGQVYVGMEPNFSGASTGTVMYWDDMSLSTS